MNGREQRKAEQQAERAARREIDAAWEAELAATGSQAQRIFNEIAAEIEAAEDWSGVPTWDDLAGFYPEAEGGRDLMAELRFAVEVARRKAED